MKYNKEYCMRLWENHGGFHHLIRNDIDGIIEVTCKDGTYREFKIEEINFEGLHSLIISEGEWEINPYL
jgi:hypothetical protein